MATATKEKTETVAFYNGRYPFESFQTAPEDPHDPATRKIVTFYNGVFIADEPWQIELLDGKPHVYRKDLPKPMVCDHKMNGGRQSCGFSTQSIDAYHDHVKTQH